MKFKDLTVGQKLVVYVRVHENVFEVKNAIVEQITPLTITFGYVNEEGKTPSGITLCGQNQRFWSRSMNYDETFKLEPPQGTIATITKVFIVTNDEKK